MALLLVLFSGGSIRDATAQIDPGIGRDIVEAVGEPTEWVADRLPLQNAQHELTGGLSPDTELVGGGFDPGGAVATGAERAGARRSPPTPSTRRRSEPSRRRSRSSARSSSRATRSRPRSTPSSPGGSPPRASRSPASRTWAPGSPTRAVVDWGRLSASEVAAEHPDAVVVFIGANEGYGMPGPDGEEVECCGPDYAAVYANRVRQVMDTFRQGGAAKVYWLTVMTPRDADAARVSKVVNAAVQVAAQPWADQVRIVDTVDVFTPGERYTDSIEVDGKDTIVRESDGIHLNEAGSAHRGRPGARPDRRRTSTTDGSPG